MSNKHNEQQDGSDHGNSGKPARPDPQPGHGKDCEVHGNHGGVNEDHCAPTPPPTTPPSTIVTTPEPTTTTTTAPDSPSPTTTSTTPASPITSTPPGLPTITITPSPESPSTTTTPTITDTPFTPPAELPHTGIGSLTLAAVAASMVLVGGVMRWLGRH